MMAIRVVLNQRNTWLLLQLATERRVSASQLVAQLVGEACEREGLSLPMPECEGMPASGSQPVYNDE